MALTFAAEDRRWEEPDMEWDEPRKQESSRWHFEEVGGVLSDCLDRLEKMRTDGQDDAGYNGLTTRSECEEGVGLVVRGSIERRIRRKSMLQPKRYETRWLSFNPLHHTSSTLLIFILHL